MPTELVRYQLDVTGVNVANTISGELHTLTAAIVRVFAPVYGPFFAESAVIYDNIGNNLLIRNQDYICVDLLQDATLNIGKEITQVILIINQSVSNQVRINYQTLGGFYQNNAADLVNKYQTIANGGNDVDWIDVANKPFQYPSALHDHLAEDIYGFESIVTSLERINNAVAMSDIPTFEALIEWIKNRFRGNYYSINPGSSNVDRGNTLTINVLSNNLANDTILYWTIQNKTTSDLDFSSMSGTINMVNNSGNFDILTELAAGIVDNETFYVAVREGSVTGNVLIETQILTLNAINSVIRVDKPTISSPVNNATTQNINVAFTSSAFAVTGGTDTHEGSDWQISTDIAFNTIVQEVINSSTNKTSWTHANLDYAETYYLRVRHKGTTHGYSSWSNITIFSTKVSGDVNTPTLVSITPSNTSISPVITTSAFSLTEGFDTHLSSDWQIATDINFTNIVRQLIDSTTSKTSWTVSPNLSYSTTYYIRFRYKGTVAGYSPWSSVTTITTAASPFVNIPSITSPTHASSNQLISVPVTSSAFAVTGDSDTHEGSDWQVATDIAFTNIVEQVTNSVTNKVTWNHTNFPFNTILYLRVRYKGVSYGYSNWSSIVTFSTETETIINENLTEIKLTASDKAFNDFFGISTDIDIFGDRAIAGASNNTVLGVTNCGAAYVFVKSSGLWTEEQMLTASDKAAGDSYGISVSINENGTRVAVGAHLKDSEDGVVYIYSRTGSLWAEEAMLIAGDVNAAGQFGKTVAIDSFGTRVAIGSPLRDSGGVVDSGAVYIFVRSGVTWTQEQVLTASDKDVNDWFGNAVDISDDGNRVVVGANDKSAGSVSLSGGAYVFVRSGTTWTEEAIIEASDAAIGDRFGISVSIDDSGARIAIGSQLRNSSGIADSGAVYIYSRSGSTWTQEQILIASDIAANEHFGSDVSINQDGSKLIVSSDFGDYSGIANRGKVYYFRRTGTVWTQTNLLVSGSGIDTGLFGTSISLTNDGAKLVSGAYREDPAGLSDAGSIYIYETNLNVNKPSIISHVNNSDLVLNGNISGSTFSVDDGTYYDQHMNTSVQASVTDTFSTVFSEIMDTVTPTEINISSLGLVEGNSYYIRIRYHGLYYGSSAWSDPVLVTAIDSLTEYIITASDKAVSDLFGYSVTIDSTGTRIAVGSIGRDSSALSDSGAVYIYLKTGSTWTQEQILIASDITALYNFGNAVAFDSTATRIIIGSNKSNIGAFANSGAAYIFSRSGTTWTQEAIISASDKSDGNEFGLCVDIDSTGTRAIIGSYLTNSGGLTDAGQAYIFVRSGTSWSEEQILFAADRLTADRFGYSVAINNAGDRVAIGAYTRESGGITNSGAVYVYTRSGSTWAQEQILTASDKADSDQFGESVSIDSTATRIAVGAYNRNSNAIASSGAVYIFIRSGTTWTQEAILTASNGHSFSNISKRSISLSATGDKLLIGAYSSNPEGIIDAGQAYIFSRSGTTWTQEQILSASDKADNDDFSFQVANNSDMTTMVACSPNRDSGGLSNAGACYVITTAGTAVITKPVITSPIEASVVGNIISVTSNAFAFTGGITAHNSSTWQLATDSGFTNIIESHVDDITNLTSISLGTSVALTVSTDYYIRVRYKGTNDVYSSYSDTLHVTTRSSFIPSSEEAIITAVDKAAADKFSWAVSIDNDGTRIAVGAYLRDSGGTVDSGAVYIYSRSGSTWTQEQILIANDKAANDWFGYSVDMNNDGSRVVIGVYKRDSNSILDSGGAYIFSRSGTTWTQEAIISASDKASANWFGNSIAIDSTGTRVVIGAYQKSSGFSLTGGAYVYSRSGTTWSEEQIILAGDKADSDQFGISCDISSDGTRIVIGSYGKDSGGVANSGAAYIFSRSGTVWTQEQVLSASDKAISDLLGYSVAINSDGSRVVVGSYTRNIGALVDAGQVYVYSRSGTTWTEEAILAASDKAAFDLFGCSVTINSDGSIIAIGAYAKDSGGLSNSGGAYIFTRSGTTWTQDAILSASDKTATYAFGTSMKLSDNGSKLIISSPDANTGGLSNSGAAYIFG